MLLAILRLHIVTPAYSVSGGQTMHVKREQFGGINLLLSLKIEANAETNRPYIRAPPGSFELSLTH